MEKTCIICNEIKEITDFYSNGRGGYNPSCKKCYNLKNKISYNKNIEKRKQYQQTFREENKEVIKERIKKSKLKLPEKYKEYRKKWRKENPEKVKESNDKCNLKSGKERVKKYYDKNKEVCIKRSVIYALKRRKIDNLYNLKHSINNIIRCSLKRKGYTKKSRTHEILGCSYDEFKIHLEQQFEPWMNWGNYGLYNGDFNYGWDIDHIVPQSTGNTEEEIIKLNHYTNLRPLCSHINRYIKKDNPDF